MQPKRKLDIEPQPAKYARMEDYFDSPKDVPANNLLPHIEKALEQIREAQSSEYSLYGKALTAVTVWGVMSQKSTSHETLKKVYGICRKIILQTAKFHSNEKGILTLKLDITNIPITRTQIDLFRFESSWAVRSIDELDKKTGSQLSLPVININQFQVMADYFMDKDPIIPPAEMHLCLAMAAGLEAPSFAATVADQMTDFLKSCTLNDVILCYSCLQSVLSPYCTSLVNACLLRLAFLPINLITLSNKEYIIGTDSYKFVVKETTSTGEKDPLYQMLCIRLAINESRFDFAKEMLDNFSNKFKNQSSVNLLAFRLLALTCTTPSKVLKKLNLVIGKEKKDCPDVIKEGVEYLNYLAKTSFQREDYLRALSFAQQALNQDPENPEALYRLAKVKGMLNKPTEDIIAQLEHVLLANKNYHKARFFLARMLDEMEKSREAIAECTILIAANYKIDVVYGYRGSMYVKLGRFAEAVSDFKKQSSLNLKIAEPHENLAEIYIKEKKYTEALKHIRQAEKIAKGSTGQTRFLKMLLPNDPVSLVAEENIDDLL